MKLLIITFILLFNVVQAQELKWFKPTKLELLSYGSMSISGIAFGYNQAITHHHYGRRDKFIDVEISFMNKYKDFAHGDLSPAYLGSKTWLVWTTDALHLSSSINMVGFASGITLNVWNIKEELSKYPKRDRWKVIIFKKILLPIVIRSVSFELTYNKLGFTK